ncbi:MAG: ABC transporter permease [Armatimonadetes bacterium]|nr:ABC transporter permease [Armatimonadota bacterium]
MKATMAIARATFGEAIRKRVLLIILLVTVLIIFVSPAFSVLSPRDQRTILLSFGLGVIQISGTLVAIILCINMLPQEIERRTIYTILSKPVMRYNFILGKYFGAVTTLIFSYFLMGLIYLLVLRQFMPGFDGEFAREVAYGIFMFFMQSSLLAAVTIFFSTFASPMVNFFLSGGAFLVGNILSTLLNTLMNNPKITEAARLPIRLLVLAMPNFSNFNVQNPIINPQQTLSNPTAYLLQTLVYALTYIVLMMVGAILIFDRREV